MRQFFVISTLALAFLPASGAHATDWYTGAPMSGGTSAGTFSKGPPPNAATYNSFGMALDAALTATSNDTLHLALIGTIAPFTSLNESGARLRLGGVTGSYSYTATTAGLGKIRGTQEQGSAMVGYEWVSRTTSVAAFIGAEVRNDKLTPNDPTNSAVGSAAGVRGELDVYTRPTTTTLVAGQFVYSSAHSAYYGRVKFGITAYKDVYVGPEMMILGDTSYSQFRVGAHVTGLNVGPMQFGVSAGFAEDRSRGSGVYGILDSRISF